MLSILDHCNVLAGQPVHRISRLQTISKQGSPPALFGSKACIYITPVLKELHWLPLRHRIAFKLMVHTYKALNGISPTYIRDLLSFRLSAVCHEHELDNFVKIKKGVRQGCVLPPDIFSLYGGYIMREIEALPGIKIGGRSINNLRYSDDTALIATSEADLQNLLNIVNQKTKSLGLGLNIKKTVTKKTDAL